MNVLVWQWGRRGAGPRMAVTLADALRALPGVRAALSLSEQAEILRGRAPPRCDLPVATYDGPAGFLWRLAQAPFALPGLTRRVRALGPDLAICAMPGPLDLLLVAALRRLRVKIVVIVHDADPHPGDAVPLQMPLQRRLIRRADAIVALSGHVADRLRAQGFGGRGGVPLIVTSHPPFVFGPPPPPPRAHGGPVRLLSFGRLRSYKGLDMLADALGRIGPRADLCLRVIGSGPESATLARLRALPGVAVENRWVPEDEIGALLAWSDALVLSHTEASQSGVAAAAVAAGRWVVATRVGGLAEQLRAEPHAVLCEPDAASLADALRHLLDAPPEGRQAASPPPDPLAAWRETARALLERIEQALAASPAVAR